MIPAALDRDRQGLPREGSRGPVADGARRDAAAPVDRRGRLAGGRAGAGRRATEEPGEARLGRRGRRAARRPRPSLRIRPPRAEASAAHAVRRRRPPAEVTTIDVPRISPDGRMLAFDAHRHRGKGPDLGAAAELAHGAGRLPGTEGRGPPVLVARQPVPRLHGRRQAQEDRRLRRAAHQDLRRARRLRRDLEPGGRDPVRRHGRRSRSTASRRREGRRSSPSSSTRHARKPRSGGPSSSPTAATTSTWSTGEKAEDSAYWIGSLDSNETDDARPGADAA